MRSKFDNPRKTPFLESLPDIGLENGKIIERSKFNFSYFDNSQEHGQDFSDWGHADLVKLLEKLKNYTCSPLDFWRNERAGAGGLKILEIYGNFPKNSDFKHPKHVPHDVQWARFRMENLVRLVGFVIPKGLECKDQKISQSFDLNTFYVVFLDKDHKFYKTESA